MLYLNQMNGAMRIATYNIRIIKGDDIKKCRCLIRRIFGIVRNVKAVNADVVGFQEVQVFHLLLLKLFLSSRYKFFYTKFRNDGIFHGGNLICWKKSFKAVSVQRLELPSGRDTAVLKILFGKRSATFVNVHFHLWKFRNEDIDVILRAIKQRLRVCLFGDFNEVSEKEDGLFKPIKVAKFRQLVYYVGGYHGYGEKENLSVDNFFVNWACISDVNVIEDFKSSDHNLMFVDLL